MRLDRGGETGVFIASPHGFPYLRRMLRLLSSLLVALALFFAPLVMANGAGMAMSHGAAETVTNMGGHCEDSDVPSPEQKSDMEMSCATVCAALQALLPPAVIGESRLSSILPGLARDQVLIGIHPEGRTPPPRMIPEI